MSVDFIDPETFFPLPLGWEHRSSFASQYGPLIVKYLYPYTIALTKISRSQPQDQRDIQALASHGLVQRDELIRLYQAIKHQLGIGRYGKLDPLVYDSKSTSIIQQIQW